MVLLNVQIVVNMKYNLYSFLLQFGGVLVGFNRYFRRQYSVVIMVMLGIGVIFLKCMCSVLRQMGMYLLNRICKLVFFDWILCVLIQFDIYGFYLILVQLRKRILVWDIVVGVVVFKWLILNKSFIDGVRGICLLLVSVRICRKILLIFGFIQNFVCNFFKILFMI